MMGPLREDVHIIHTAGNNAIMRNVSLDYRHTKRTIEDALKELELFVASRGSNSQCEDLFESGGYPFLNTLPVMDGREVSKAREAYEKQFGQTALVPKTIDVPEGSKFFVIKSLSIEHIKMSYAHEIWSSTYLGNKRLSEAYKKTAQDAKTYLFYSVNGSGRFCGVAEMVSDLLDDLDTSIWTDNKKKYGKAFKVKWIVVRDIQNRQLKQYLVPCNDMKPVTRSRDTQEIPMVVGASVLQTFLCVNDRSDLRSFLAN